MPILDEFEKRFERPQSAWTREQWKQAAIELASMLHGDNRTPLKRGRPRHDATRYVIDKNGRVTISQKSNYAALAWQVQQRMEQADAAGRPLKIKDAVREELLYAIRRHNKQKPENRGERGGEIRESRVNYILPTAYTEVRKILRGWKKEEKK